MLAAMKQAFKQKDLVRVAPRFSFGIYTDVTQRTGQKMQEVHKVKFGPELYATTTRPGNFGNHLDLQLNIDNWFDENRLYNEHETNIKRAHLQFIDAAFFGSFISILKMLSLGLFGYLLVQQDYDEDTHLEFDLNNI